MRVQYAVMGMGMGPPDDLFTPKDKDISDGRHYDSEDGEYLAQECAEDFHWHHDGWECSWPKEIDVFLDGVSIGVYSVDRELVPSFSARRKL